MLKIGKKKVGNPLNILVQDRRLELPRPKIGHKILSLARLPIPPILQNTY